MGEVAPGDLCIRAACADTCTYVGSKLLMQRQTDRTAVPRLAHAVIQCWLLQGLVVVGSGGNWSAMQCTTSTSRAYGLYAFSLSLLR